MTRVAVAVAIPAPHGGGGATQDPRGVVPTVREGIVLLLPAVPGTDLLPGLPDPLRDLLAPLLDPHDLERGRVETNTHGDMVSYQRAIFDVCEES